MQIVQAPLSGRAVPLTEIPDEVFSQRVLGDGIAIIPEDGKLLSPVDGEVTTVAETLHAYGFASEDGLDILVHVGLETVSLKGQGFKAHVQPGDKVKKGDLIAEVDLDFLKAQGLNTVTPVLVCDGADGMQMDMTTGKVTAGKDMAIGLFQICEDAPVVAEKPKKAGINFDFLQKLGRSRDTARSAHHPALLHHGVASGRIARN